jgi:hypothetical protein
LFYPNIINVNNCIKGNHGIHIFPGFSSAISKPFKLVTLTLVIFEKSIGKWNGILKTEKKYL